MTQKPDAIRIQAHIDQLKEAAWLGTARAWWPDYVFHFTDINNVPKILRAGYLLSRERALQINPDFIDSGSRSVLQKTAEQWKQYVRFYFRPKTPTLYRNEGIRPLKAQTLEAHCPVPIYLLFDSKAVLSLAETKFSNGNLARQNTFTYFGAADFERLPFQSIYHDGSISNNIDKDNIINCRHAEIIVPNQINLSALKQIWCRSQAEYNTLRFLLGEEWLFWANKVTSRTDRILFNRQWTYIETVELTSTFVTIRFHEALKTSDQGPYNIRVEFIQRPESVDQINQYAWRDDQYNITNKKRVLKFSLMNFAQPVNQYIIRVYLDNALCYADEYVFIDSDDIPF